jgi:hypothetical protein
LGFDVPAAVLTTNVLTLDDVIVTEEKTAMEE